MELVYVWLEECNCIKNQEFNFSPRYRFSFKRHSYKTYLDNIIEAELIKEDLNPTTDNNFFGNHISNITAIVGKNGTGKSSLINQICSFPSSNFRGHGISIYINNQSELFLYTSYNPERVNISRNFDCKISYYFTLSSELNDCLKNTSFVYLNHSILLSDFSRHNFSYTDKFINLSSISLLETNGFKGINNIEVYQQLDTLLNAEYLRDLNINKPEKLKISINTEYKNNNKEDTNKEIINTFNDLFDKRKMLDGFFESFFLMSTFYLLFDHRGLDKKITQTIFLEQKNKAFINNKDIPITDFIFLCLDKIEQVIKSQERELGRKDYQVNRIKYIREFLKKIISFFDYIEKNNIKVKQEGGSSNQNTFTSGGFVINLLKDGLYDSELITRLCNVFSYTNIEINNYVKEIFPHNYINLSWWQFSSGEQVMLSTFSRLYNIKEAVVDNDIILLIDEGELYLHPQWQKRYIHDLINLLDIVFGDKKVQIILTSHSPFIISDLPKENVIFLDKDDKGNCKVVSGLEKQQTFGANIHTLFTEAFFLEDGLIGNFAKQKINDVIKDLKNNPTQEKIEHAEKLINLIGEPVLRIKLTQLLNDVKKQS